MNLDNLALCIGHLAHIIFRLISSYFISHLHLGGPSRMDWPGPLHILDLFVLWCFIWFDSDLIGIVRISTIDNFIAKNRKLHPYELSNDDWDAITPIKKWLKSFHLATTQMSTTKASMLSTTHAIFHGLQEDIHLSPNFLNKLWPSWRLHWSSLTASSVTTTWSLMVHLIIHGLYVSLEITIFAV